MIKKLRSLFWHNTARLHPFVGRVVLDIEARGCMAETHVLKRCGTIRRVIDQREIYGEDSQSIIVADCELLDSRSDRPREMFTVPLADIHPTYKGSKSYYWIH